MHHNNNLVSNNRVQNNMVQKNLEKNDRAVREYEELKTKLRKCFGCCDYYGSCSCYELILGCVANLKHSDYLTEEELFAIRNHSCLLKCCSLQNCQICFPGIKTIQGQWGKPKSLQGPPKEQMTSL